MGRAAQEETVIRNLRCVQLASCVDICQRDLVQGACMQEDAVLSHPWSLECFWSPGRPVKEFTRLGYTGLVVELEHLKIETRLIDEKLANTMGEYVT